MLLRVKGRSKNINDFLVGSVTRDFNKIDKNTFLIIDIIVGEIPLNDSLAVLTTSKNVNGYNQTLVEGISTLEYLEEGDIIVVSDDGNVNTLYRVNSLHNTLLVTERCNSNCLMCSQPPKNIDDIERLFNIHKKLIPLIPKDCVELGISGGEPTLLGKYFFELLKMIVEYLPETEVHILSNGRTFAWYDFTEQLTDISSNRIMFGIPLYSDFYQIHDYIVQAKDAFDQTILGLYNLNRFNQRIEIRIVLHKQTTHRLVKLAKYIYKNLPFVEHIAFMGLEYIGYTPYNIDKLWIDPYDYKDELEEAVEYLVDKGMNVSIYNTPLCLLPMSIRGVSRKSISDWKNEYLPECSNCLKLNDCGGFFKWNLKKVSDHILPFN
ncbi:His-Xaa-Ser system radical SAM maturase HxsC [Myroides phaeus]|uniref:His-Xaa-Ser system radical SAM maturase HxsC n=1 Tax=Myroides phaeus TaxID=702745 RepID=UPI00130394C0|nr:His-Xaa-Ser system radical SAM maturase HxsC [Myroides phaeus]